MSLPLTDFEGDPRDNPPDMGVDEFVKEDRGGGLEDYVLYATEKVRLRRIADSQGNVGSNGSIVIGHGRSGTLEGNLTALGKIKVYGSITIEGEVFTNSAVHVRHGWAKLDVTGQIIEGEEANLSSTNLPELDFTAGSPNARVRRNRSLSLEPGTYGKVRVMRGARLHLSDGEYYMERLVVHCGATISIEGPVTINVVNGLYMGRNAEIEIESGKTRDLTINVLNGNPVWIGSYAVVRGTLVASNARVWLGYRSELEGAVYARRIYAGCRVHFEPHAE
jgi:hypothetical protein